MTAWATQRVATSASVRLRRAFFAFSGRRSSAVQNTAVSSRSRSASIVALLWVDGADRHRRLRSLPLFSAKGVNAPLWSDSRSDA